MTKRLLLFAMLMSLPRLALAGGAEVLSAAPMLADGQGEVIVLVHVPGLTASDKVKVKPYDGELRDARVAGPDLLELRLAPSERYKADNLRVNLKIKGGIKLTEDVLVPLTGPPRGKLEVKPEADTWTVGERGTLQITVIPDGHHPLPPEARDVALRASEGTLGPVTRDDQGRFTATWTPPSKRADPAVVVFSALDLTAPSEVVGVGTVALLVKKQSTVKAPPGSQNVVIVGEQQIGPETAPASGEVRFDALLDPRSPKVTLQSVDDVGQRSVSELPLSFEAPSPVLLMPLPDKLPAGSPLTVYAAAFNAEGQAWSGAAPELDGYGQGRVEGQGVFSWTLTTPAEPGSWTLTVSTEEGEDSLTRALIRPALALQLSADPPTLSKANRDVAVTANIKGPDGQAITGLKPRFTAEGASANGGVKDNGDGTYTQRYRVNSSAESAQFRATLPPATTGLPPARIVAWPSKSALPADGRAQIEISVVVVDALGLPVPNQTVALTTPIGDGAIPPEVRTDNEGVAALSYRAGTQAGPALVRVDASGVVGELVLWQHAPDAAPPQPSLVGDALAREGTARWQAARPSLSVVRVGVDVGPPAALTVTTVPDYTTPGAAILVQVKVFDASGKVSPGVPPRVSASVGTVGAVTDNGDGSYNVPVQLPPGVDGPLTLDVRAGDARGSASLATLASMGGPSAVVSDAGGGNNSGGNNSGSSASGGRDSGGRDSGGRDSGGRDSGGRDSGGRTSVSGDEKVWLRVVATDTWIQHESASTGDAEAPVSASIQRPLPFGALGAGLDLVAHPTGGPFGLDLRARGAAYRYALGAGAAEEVVTDTLYSAALGARFSPGPGNTARPYLGLAVGVTDSLAFTYADSAKASAAPQNLLVPGLVVNAGLNVDTPKVDVSLQLSELLGPKPSMSHAGLLFDLAVLPGAASLTLGVEADLQHLSAEVGPAATEVTISSLRASAVGGLAFTF